jgi:hypothetical protein
MKNILLSLLILTLIFGCSTTNTETESTDTQEETSQFTKSYNLEVPFTTQAPFAEWDDPIQQDACEEASALMAMLWIEGESKISKSDARETILDLAEFQDTNFGFNKDTSSEDTYKRIFQGYYNHEKAFVKVIRTRKHIVSELAQDRLVLVPVDGKALNNPNFSNGGPDKHMLVIKGYDHNKDEFITNDPGTRKGQNYRYDAEVLLNAVKNYKTTNSNNSFTKLGGIVVKKV